MQPIYIEVSDEITTVIGRMKEASDLAVALVVPKGALLLQSSVNLKLAKKAAADAGKQLSIVTTDKIGKNLAGQVGIPVFARLGANDQPEGSASDEPESEDAHIVGGVKVHRYYERGEADAEEEDEAIEPIVPKQILKEAQPSATPDDTSPIVIRAIETAEEPAVSAEPPAEPPVVTRVYPRERQRPGAISRRSISEAEPAEPLPVAPGAERVRRRPSRASFLAGYLLILLLLIAAGLGIYYLPRTSVVVTVRPTAWSRQVAVTAKGGAAASGDGLLVPAQVTSLDTTGTLNFTATGSKDVGKAAKGTAQVTNDYSTNAQTLPAGSHISAEGVDFTTDSAVTVPGFTAPYGDKIPGTATVGVTASAAGSNGNQTSTAGTFTSPATKVYAKIVQTSGGSSQTVKVVTATDIANAKGQLADKLKADLAGKLSEAAKAGDSLFDAGKDTYSLSDVASTVSADTQADGGTVTAKESVSRLSVDKSVLSQAADKQASAQVAAPDTTVAVAATQLGATSVNADGTISASLTVTGSTTPTLSLGSLPVQLAGKAQATADSILAARAAGNAYAITRSPSWWPLHRFPLSSRSISVSERHE